MRVALLALAPLAPLVLAAPSRGGLVDLIDQVADLGTWVIGQTAAAVGTLDDKDEQRSVLQVLKADSAYSRIVKLIEFTNMAKELDDASSKITFMAPNDGSFAPPSYDYPHSTDKKYLIEFPYDMSLLVKVLNYDPDLNKFSGGERDKIREAAQDYLAYHIIDQSLGQRELLGQRTWETRCKRKDVLAGQPLVIRVSRDAGEQLTTLNGGDIEITSCHAAGQAHVCHITSELDFPLSMLDAIYENGHAGSAFSSFMARLKRQDDLDYSPEHGDGTEIITALVFSENALYSAPRMLSDILLSNFPFQARAARALLDCFLMPNTTVTTNGVCVRGNGGDLKCDHVDKYPATATLQGRTCNMTVRFEEDDVKGLWPYKQRTMSFNGIRPTLVDVPALNGPFHVFDEMPLPCEHIDVDGEQVKCTWDTMQKWVRRGNVLSFLTPSWFFAWAFAAQKDTDE